MSSAPYVYRATCEAWHDGDTGTFLLDLGFNVYARWPVRLLGCNAIELAKPGGKEARDHILTLCPVGTQVTVESATWDKYARVDGIVLVPSLGADFLGDLAERMIRDGYAAEWDGTGKAPIPPWPIPVPPTG